VAVWQPDADEEEDLFIELWRSLNGAKTLSRLDVIFLDFDEQQLEQRVSPHFNGQWALPLHHRALFKKSSSMGCIPTAVRALCNKEVEGDCNVCQSTGANGA